MKKTLAFYIMLSLLYSCGENEQKIEYYTEFSVLSEFKENGCYTINESNGEYLAFGSPEITGSFQKGKKNGLWKYRSIDGFNMDSIVLYKYGQRLCQLNVIYESDYSQIKDGCYLYSSRIPYDGLVPFVEYGRVKNRNKEGEWVEIIDWKAFSSMSYLEKRIGNYKNGKKIGKWLNEYTNYFCDDELNCFQTSVVYYKSYNDGKLVSFEGYLVKNNLGIDELKFYTPNSCIFKVQQYEDGIKNGKEEYYDCSIVDAFEENKIMEKNYKNGKLQGKLYRYVLGETIYEADYENGVKLNDTTLVQWW